MLVALHSNNPNSLVNWLGTKLQERFKIPLSRADEWRKMVDTFPDLEKLQEAAGERIITLPPGQTPSHLIAFLLVDFVVQITSVRGRDINDAIAVRDTILRLCEESHPPQIILLVESIPSTDDPERRAFLQKLEVLWEMPHIIELFPCWEERLQEIEKAFQGLGVENNPDR